MKFVLTKEEAKRLLDSVDKNYEDQIKDVAYYSLVNLLVAKGKIRNEYEKYFSSHEKSDFSDGIIDTTRIYTGRDRDRILLNRAIEKLDNIKSPRINIKNHEQVDALRKAVSYSSGCIYISVRDMELISDSAKHKYGNNECESFKEVRKIWVEIDGLVHTIEMVDIADTVKRVQKTTFSKLLDASSSTYIFLASIIIAISVFLGFLLRA